VTFARGWCRPDARAIVIGLALVLGGCSGEPQPAEAIHVALQTIEVPADMACGDVGFTTVLHGNPNAPDVAWLGQFPAGAEHFRLVWPTGYNAVFDPQLNVVDGNGHIQIREGDFVDGVCGEPLPDTYLMRPPSLAFRLVCGPMAVDECTSGRISEAVRKSGGPERPIALIEFITADGKYRVIYEDGTEATGFTSSN
jgi:hypothetical protein